MRAMIATIAISARINAYSARPWPSSSLPCALLDLVPCRFRQDHIGRHAGRLDPRRFVGLSILHHRGEGGEQLAALLVAAFALRRRLRFRWLLRRSLTHRTHPRIDLVRPVQ